MSPKNACPGKVAAGDRPVAKSRARVTFFPEERREVERITSRWFGRRLWAWELAGLAGAPDDAEVDVGTFRGQIYLELNHPAASDYGSVQLLRFSPAGPVLVIEELHVHRRGMQTQGLGLAIFARQLSHARRLGIRRIETVAGRGRRENGYYTWPRFGFDAPLPLEVRRRLPMMFRRAARVGDLMEREAGRSWWRKHGVPLSLAFDLESRSRCWKRFDRYIRARSHRA